MTAASVTVFPGLAGDCFEHRLEAAAGDEHGGASILVAELRQRLARSPDLLRVLDKQYIPDRALYMVSEGSEEHSPLRDADLVPVGARLRVLCQHDPHKTFFGLRVEAEAGDLEARGTDSRLWRACLQRLRDQGLSAEVEDFFFQCFSAPRPGAARAPAAAALGVDCSFAFCLVTELLTAAREELQAGRRAMPAKCPAQLSLFLREFCWHHRECRGHNNATEHPGNCTLAGLSNSINPSSERVCGQVYSPQLFAAADHLLDVVAALKVGSEHVQVSEKRKILVAIDALKAEFAKPHVTRTVNLSVRHWSREKSCSQCPTMPRELMSGFMLLQVSMSLLS